MFLTVKYVFATIFITWTTASGSISQDELLDNHPDYNDIVDQNTMHCFQCNSRQDPDCINIQPNDTLNYHFKPCLDTDLYQGQQPFCRKIVQRIYERDNLEIVVRKCGWIRHPRLDCYGVKNDDHEEIICQCFSPGCNGSSSLQPSVAVVASVVLAQVALVLRRK